MSVPVEVPGAAGHEAQLEVHAAGEALVGPIHRAPLGQAGQGVEPGVLTTSTRPPPQHSRNRAPPPLPPPKKKPAPAPLPGPPPRQWLPPAPPAPPSAPSWWPWLQVGAVVGGSRSCQYVAGRRAGAAWSPGRAQTEGGPRSSQGGGLGLHSCARYSSCGQGLRWIGWRQCWLAGG